MRHSVFNQYLLLRHMRTICMPALHCQLYAAFTVTNCMLVHQKLCDDVEVSLQFTERKPLHSHSMEPGTVNNHVTKKRSFALSLEHATTLLR